MRILVVGAGAIGGYFGGRLQEKGEDVTFLVRARRKAQLEATGLNIKSEHGDIELKPKLITAEESTDAFDVILLSTKSYHLEGAIRDLRSFTGKDTMIVPLLNGVAHIETLVEAFGEEAVLGGLCFVETTLDGEGTIIQTSPAHQLVYGERDGTMSERMTVLQKIFGGTKADFKASGQISREMWHKYMFITAMSGITTAMESPVGPIMETKSGRNTVEALLKEIGAVMNAMAAPISADASGEQFARISGLKPEMKSSMQRDAEKAMPLESGHLQGYLLEKAYAYQITVPVLETIYTRLVLAELRMNNRI